MGSLISEASVRRAHHTSPLENSRGSLASGVGLEDKFICHVLENFPLDASLLLGVNESFGITARNPVGTKLMYVNLLDKRDGPSLKSHWLPGLGSWTPSGGSAWRSQMAFPDWVTCPLPLPN